MHAPGRTRTCDPRLRRPSLYPAELRGLAGRVTVRPRRLSRAASVGILGGATLAVLASASAGAVDVRAHSSGHRGHVAVCLVPGTRRTIDQLWRPEVTAARAYARARRGDIAFAVRTAHAFYGYRADHDEWSASVVKAMLLVSYLDEPWVRARALRPDETDVLGPMIRASNNDDAQQIFDTVGQSGLGGLAHRVGMTRFATNPVWGATDVTARDQTRFFLYIDGFVARRHRSYAMRLLRSIVPWERWGIGELAPRGWRLYFKGGWGYGTGLIDHQVALLVRGCARVSIAVLTMYDGSHAYGKATLKAIFARLLHGFPTLHGSAADQIRPDLPYGPAATGGCADPGAPVGSRRRIRAATTSPSNCVPE
jgi:hypothetical protein